MSRTIDLSHPAPSNSPQAEQRRASTSRQPGESLLLPGEAIDSLRQVHATLRTQLPQGQLDVYEAGGGSTSFLPTDVLSRSKVTVVDIDQDQLANNAYAQTTILGDLQTYRFKPASFDLVTCYNVIEHIPDVEAALTGFFQSLKPGGLAVIAAPHPNSLSGVVTKHTPHWFHVWYYRHVRGIKSAGLPGEAPFPTCFHPLVSPARLATFARKQGAEIVYQRTFESPRYPEMRARMPVLAALIDGFAAVSNKVLPKGFDIRHGDYHLVLRKL
jgi:SAM-dependent methyltransferase